MDSIEDELELKYEDAPRYTLQYSSVERYLDCVFDEAKERKVQFSRYSGDFWAYNLGSKPNAFWTGYFSTHPDFKLKATEFSDFVQSA